MHVFKWFVGKKKLQPFANYCSALGKKKKSCNYIVRPVKLFVLTLKRRLAGDKTLSYIYDDKTIRLAVKIKFRTRN